MATAPTLPVDTTGAFELPPSAATATQNRKEVTWTSGTVENSAKTVELRLFPVKYQITAHLIMIEVLKTTLKMFLATDPTVYIVSRVNEEVIIKTALYFATYTSAQLRKCFPGKIINGSTNLRMMMASSMSINRLKKSSYGYYEYASPHIWLSDDLFESNNIRNIGFIIRKDINRVDRQLFNKELSDKLGGFPCSADDLQRLTDAHSRLAFPACIPNFQI
jgi:hypothetical protein